MSPDARHRSYAAITDLVSAREEAMRRDGTPCSNVERGVVRATTTHPAPGSTRAIARAAGSPSQTATMATGVTLQRAAQRCSSASGLALLHADETNNHTTGILSHGASLRFFSSINPRCVLNSRASLPALCSLLRRVTSSPPRCANPSDRSSPSRRSSFALALSSSEMSAASASAKAGPGAQAGPGSSGSVQKRLQVRGRDAWSQTPRAPPCAASQ